MTPTSNSLENALLPLAAEEARRYRHQFIETEHLLLALVRFAKDVPIFQIFDLTEANIRRRVEPMDVIGPAGNATDALSQSSCVKKSLDLAWGFARKAKKGSIDTDDLLGGLAVEAVSGVILAHLGVSEPLIRQVR